MITFLAHRMLHINPSTLRRSMVPLAIATLFFCTATASAQGTVTAPSFGAIFFWSCNADGSIEWIGSSMIWVLIFLSMYNVSLSITLWRENQTAIVLPPRVLSEFRDRLQSGRYRDALDLASIEKSDLARTLRAALTQAPAGTDAMVRAAEEQADVVLAERLRRIERLNILGQIAPMIGLFGTVYGMIVAFMVIAATGGNADPVMLAGGIGTALVTTFWGLLIAIPATAMYAVVRNRAIALSESTLGSVEEMLALFRPKASATETATKS
ncbi:MAG: MotA/TolQ/ExbB proton channel family protein [Phycisphaerales bacterium]|nr:MotA/TolQ/ExbB proton channel family protein [Phycisphaerales bacterium]